MSYDIIPDVLTATAGTRYYHYSEWQTGTEFYTTAAQVNVPNGTYVGNDTEMNYHTTYHGFKSRANLQWHIAPNTMVYYTFSQGFRPGGFNRTTSDVAKLDGEPQYSKPTSYAPDTLTNNEVGFKSTFFDDRLLFNASVYDMRWDNVQMQFFNPLVLGNTTFAVNGPNYKVDGVWNCNSRRVLPMACRSSAPVRSTTPNRPTHRAWSTILRLRPTTATVSSKPELSAPWRRSPIRSAK
jgi:iron complex outermembrane receptor protein